MAETREPRRDGTLTVAEERAAWAKHNRESILRGLELTAAQRFEWLEQMQAAFQQQLASRMHES